MLMSYSVVRLVKKNKNKNKNKNNFILHRHFKITNSSCQLFIDEMIYTNIDRLYYDKTLHNFIDTLAHPMILLKF